MGRKGCGKGLSWQRLNRGVYSVRAQSGASEHPGVRSRLWTEPQGGRQMASTHPAIRHMMSKSHGPLEVAAKLVSVRPSMQGWARLLSDHPNGSPQSGGTILNIQKYEKGDHQSVASETVNYALIRQEYQRRLETINDIFIETDLVVRGLELMLEKIKEKKAAREKTYKVAVPSTKGPARNLKRNLDQVRSIVQDRISAKEYIQSLVFAISFVESYLSSSLINLIRAYPQKLLVSTKGIKIKDSERWPVDVREVIEANSLTELISEKASQRVRDALYASPMDYFKYCAVIFGFSLSTETCERFCELKATRDVYVHGEGVASDIYVRKCGNRARAKVGERLLVDREYFSSCFVCMKALVVETHRGLQEKYGNSQQLRRILKT